MASGAQTLTAKQLVILQYLATRCTAELPEGWTRIETMERRIRFGALTALDKNIPERMPIQEDLLGSSDGIFPLTGQRSPREDPYVLISKSQTIYRISESGKAMVKRCGLVKKSTARGDEIIVVDKRTNRPPIIESAETPVVTADDDDDDGPEDISAMQTPPPPPHPDVEPQRDDVPHAGALAEEVYDGLDEEGLNSPQARDEINAEAIPRGMAATTAAPPPAPAKPPKQGKPAARAPRKAAVPGRRE